MSGSRGSYWDDSSSLRNMMENLMPGRGRMHTSGTMGIHVPVDVRETDHEYIVQAFIPGARAEDIHIQVHDDTLQISGETKAEQPEEGKSGRWLVREQPTGHFHRTIALPQPVQADKVEADFHQGVLTVRLPESEESRPRTIPIQMAGSQQGTQGQGQSASSQTSPAGQTSASTQTQSAQGGRPAEEYSPTERSVGAPISPASNSSPGAIDRWMSQVKAGMTVTGSDGTPIGHVVQVHQPYFLIERPGGKEYELYVPYDAIQEVQGDSITLDVPSDQIDQQEWAAFTGTSAGT